MPMNDLQNVTNYESLGAYLNSVCFKFQKQTSNKKQWKWIYTVSLFSQMESNFLFWRKSCTVSIIFSEYQWYLIGKPMEEDFLSEKFFCKNIWSNGLFSF